MTNGVQAGWKKFAMHFFGFGVPFGTVVWFGGWSGAAVLVSWRAYEEFLDWKEGRDTLGKAAIDLLSQTAAAAAIAIVKR